MKFACHRKDGRLINALIVICAAIIFTLKPIVPASAGTLEEAEAAFLKKDYATALRLFRPLADKGNAIAQDRIGTMYLWGSGVPQDRHASVPSTSHVTRKQQSGIA